jgi:hypothetical protein
VRDQSQDNLARSFVCEVENSIITYANAPPVAILELLAASWKGLFFQREKHAGDALLNRIRICASDKVLSEAERALASITEQYFSPNLSLEQWHALVRDGARSDPLRSFAEACRAEVRSMPTAS